MYITEHSRNADVSWIPASEALSLATSAFENNERAREFIIRRAGADLILSRCRSMRCEKRAAQSKVVERERCLISPEFWEQYVSARRSLQDWASGDFERTSTNGLGARDIVLILGTEFSKADLLAQLPSQPVKWISASQAIQQVEASNGARNAAVSIFTRANAGLLATRAQLFRRQVAQEHGRKGLIEDRDCLLPKDFWWTQGRAGVEANWGPGDFETLIDSTFLWQAFGVAFDQAGIDAMCRVASPAAKAVVPQLNRADKEESRNAETGSLPALAVSVGPALPPQDVKRNEGGRPPVYDWERAVAAIVFQWADDGSWQPVSQADVKNKLAEWFASDRKYPSDSLLKSRARWLYEEFQRRNGEANNFAA